MQFTQSFLSSLKQKTDCIEVITTLGHRVSRNVTNCIKPENHKHGDASPSLMVSPRGFKCMVPSCNISGGCIELVQYKLNVSFEQSVVYLAALLEVTPETVKEGDKVEADKEALKIIKEKAKQEVKARQKEEKVTITGPSFTQFKEQANYAKFCHEAYIALLGSTAAQEYLKKRGISMETAKKCFLGFQNKMIIVPYIIDGKIVYYSGRSIEDKTFYQPTGQVPCPIGYDTLKTNRIIYIAEGLFDYLTLIEKGYSAIGVPGASAWKNSREWNSLLLGNKIMLCFHADEDGFRTNQKLSIICQGLSVPYEVVDWSKSEDIKVTDINEFVIGGGDVNKLFSRDHTITLEEIKDTFRELIDLSDYDEAVDLVIASVVANVMQGDPFWILFVGPPSVGKTEIIRGVNNAVSTYFINRISPNTLISGFTRTEYSDVITRIVKPTTFCITDFGSFLAFHPQDMQKIMQQLRDVYDGKVHVEYGNGKIVDWTGKVGFIGGITTEIERHSTFIGRLGDRFLYYRMEIAEEKRKQIAVNALLYTSKEDDKRKKIRDISSRYIDWLVQNIEEANSVEITKEIAEKVASASDFLARARTPVARMHDMIKTVEYLPIYEATGRVARAFKVLIKALAFVRGKSCVDEDDYFVLKKIANGSIPSIRREFLKVAYETRTGWMTTSEYGKHLGKDTGSARYHLQNLLVLGLIDIETTGKDHKWKLKSEAINLIEESRFFE